MGGDVWEAIEQERPRLWEVEGVLRLVAVRRESEIISCIMWGWMDDVETKSIRGENN